MEKSNRIYVKTLRVSEKQNKTLFFICYLPLKSDESENYLLDVFLSPLAET